LIRHVPNLLTLARILAAPFVLRLAWNGRYEWALMACFAAGCTDFLDGYLARRYHAESRLGAWMDPLGDKLLLSGMFLVLGWKAVIPWWLTLVVFGRDASILLFAGAAILFTRIRDFPPSVWGKISTAVQIATALVVLVAQTRLGAAAQPLAGAAIVCTAAAAVWSGLHYGWTAIRRLRPAAH
jgi:cardiolipin synthase (CMP-forming)